MRPELASGELLLTTTFADFVELLAAGADRPAAFVVALIKCDLCLLLCIVFGDFSDFRLRVFRIYS